MSYNGWTNWETWNVNLWIDNEYDMYRAKMDFFRKTENVDCHNVKDFCCSILPNGMTPDMDSESEMNSVNWEEIAAMWAVEKSD